jgi:hypothetical protein
MNSHVVPFDRTQQFCDPPAALHRLFPSVAMATTPLDVAAAGSDAYAAAVGASPEIGWRWENAQATVISSAIDIRVSIFPFFLPY